MSPSTLRVVHCAYSPPPRVVGHPLTSFGGAIFFGFFRIFLVFFSTPNRTGENEHFPHTMGRGIEKEKVDSPLVIDSGVFPTRSPNPTAQFDHRRNNSAIGVTCKTLVTELTTASQALYRPKPWRGAQGSARASLGDCAAAGSQRKPWPQCFGRSRNPSSGAWSRVCGTLAAGFRLVPCA